MRYDEGLLDVKLCTDVLKYLVLELSSIVTEKYPRVHVRVNEFGHNGMSNGVCRFGRQREQDHKREKLSTQTGT